MFRTGRTVMPKFTGRIPVSTPESEQSKPDPAVGEVLGGKLSGVQREILQVVHMMRTYDPDQLTQLLIKRYWP